MSAVAEFLFLKFNAAAASVEEFSLSKFDVDAIPAAVKLWLLKFNVAAEFSSLKFNSQAELCSLKFKLSASSQDPLNLEFSLLTAYLKLIRSSGLMW